MGDTVLNIPESEVGASFKVLTFAPTLTPNARGSQRRIVTLTGNLVMNAPINLKNGDTILFKMLNDGTGGYTITWNSAYKFTGGTAPTMTTTASKYDMYSFIYDGTDLSCTVVQNL